MAAKVTILVSLILEVLGSGIVFYSGPPAALIYLRDNTNVSIYDIEQLSPLEEKSLGENNSK